MDELQHAGKTSDNLGVRALLYASAGMNADEAAEFESELGFDQRAREALQEAVAFLQRWGEDLPVQPSPRYRQRVRERLLRGGALVFKRLTARRFYRGHPLAWGIVGAAAAALLVAVLFQQPTARGTLQPPTNAAAQPRHTAPAQAADELGPMNDEELGLWADLPRSRHLLKVHHEESERKRRSELQMRIVLRDGMGGQVNAKQVPAN